MNMTLNTNTQYQGEVLITPRKLSLMNHHYKGRLISLCGIDGSGKSSIIKKIESHVKSRHIPCSITYLPTERIRKNTLFRELVDTDREGVKPASTVNILGLSLTIMGDFMQHLTDTLIPCLQRGDIVICDRYIYTNQAELLARGNSETADAILATIAKQVLAPDLAITMDIPTNIARQRILERQDAEDPPGEKEFTLIQEQAYRHVAQSNQLVTISSDRAIEDTFSQLQPHLERCLAEYR